MTFLRKIVLYLIIWFFCFILSLYIINIYIVKVSDSKIFNSVNSIENTNIWLVLWASVKSNETPSDILKDRLDKAIEAYNESRINKIIVSWDNRVKYYNEPLVMKKYLIKYWVSKDDIYLDYAWFDTYDSIYRSKYIFWVNSLVIFTQKFHQNRAVYIWNSIWIDTIWVSSDKQTYLWINYFKFREFFSRVKAFLEVEIIKAKPKFLGDSIEIISDEKVENIKTEVLKTKNSDKLPILMYHYVRDVNINKDLLWYNLSVSPELFEKQIKYLNDFSYKTVNSEDIINKNIIEKDILLVFDDGYKDFYTKAFPILKKYNLKASVWIICSKIWQESFMNEQDINEIISYWIEIINHTQNHLDLRTLNKKWLEKEIISCHNYLKDKFWVTISSIVYPAGRYNSNVIDFLEETNYSIWFTTKPWIANLEWSLLELNRIRVDNRVSFNSFVKNLN